MPMRNYSTLIYFVNNFQADLNSSKIVENGFENSLTKMVSTEIEPSEQSIENILNFARSYEVLETQNAGYVEMILN